MTTTVVHELAPYPSSATRKSLSPSQKADFNHAVSVRLDNILSLPPNKRDIASTHIFLKTYAQDRAQQTLQGVIWQEPLNEGVDEKAVYKRSLALAHKLLPNDIQLLLDLAISYTRTYPKSIQALFTEVSAETRDLPATISTEVVPSFILLLQSQDQHQQGLYAHRKVLECIYAFVRACKSTPDLLRPFTQSKPFIIALAQLYDGGLARSADTYGGIAQLRRALSSTERSQPADDWEKIWMNCKVAILDTFHIIISELFRTLATNPVTSSGAEHVFDVVFALLDILPTSHDEVSSTPFLDQSLLKDHQGAYNLSQTLTNALLHSQEKDARLDILESALRDSSGAGGSRNPGGLTILLRSSGIPTTSQIDYRGVTKSREDKGKSKDVGDIEERLEDNANLDLQVTQVLDILPDADHQHIRHLLKHERFGGNAERVIEAMLEGTAPSLEDLPTGGGPNKEEKEEWKYSLENRKNVFDDEVVDVSQFRIGKKAHGDEILRDRSFVEEMKADILRRAEALSDLDEESGLDSKGKSKEFAPVSTFDDDDDLVSTPNLRLAADGSDESEEDDLSEGDEGSDNKKDTPESLIERAYLRDPKLFDRDGSTRRSNGRVALRAETGWSNEQIEGWKIMLDRNPKGLEKLKEKYEFRGNEKGLDLHGPSEASGRGRGGGERGRGFTRGRGRGRGGHPPASTGEGTSGETDTAKDRAWKDKHKSSRGNHNRKRGHDKKLARAGFGTST